MSLLTFSSNVLKNGSGTPSSEFTTFSTVSSKHEDVVQIRGRIGDSKPVALTLRGSDLIDRMTDIKGVEAVDLMSSADPETGLRRTLDGFRIAVARAGHLVDLTMWMYGQAAAVTETGVIANVAFRTGPRGGADQQLDMIFYPCELLRLLDGTTEQKPGS